MEISDYIKTELYTWKKSEIMVLFGILSVIIINALIVHDGVIPLISALCGILYTFIAGKGKIYCYFFGLCGTGLYSYLALRNALYGNFFLYLCYYFPMQIIGIFEWNKHLKKDENTIEKTRMNNTERVYLSGISLLLCVIVSYIILFLLKGAQPVFDGVTTTLSVIGMYLTVKRKIEQWIIWMIVNILSVIMWLSVLMEGEKVYSTLIMWMVYFMLAVYFYAKWVNELKNTYSNDKKSF